MRILQGLEGEILQGNMEIQQGLQGEILQGKIWESCKDFKEKSCKARYGNPARPARRNPTRQDMGILQGLQEEILLGKI